MSLRADAEVFIPGALARHEVPLLAKGDRLIQELAAILLPPTPPPPPPPPPCFSKTAEFQELPAAGIFCPYCIAGADCAFHKSAIPDTAILQFLMQPEGCKLRVSGSFRPQTFSKSADADHFGKGSLPAMPDSTMLFNAASTANSCLAFVEECMLDVISESQDSDGASTEVGTSEAWCNASDTSDPSPGLSGYVDGLRAYGARYSAAAYPGGMCRHTQSISMAHAR